MHLVKAKAMWDEWNNNPEHLRDNLGPNGALQFYVRTDIEILEDDVYTKGKQLKQGDKSIEDATPEMLTKMRRRMQTGFEELGEEPWSTIVCNRLEVDQRRDELAQMVR